MITVITDTEYPELLDRLRVTSSATQTLAEWLGVSTLELYDVEADPRYALSDIDVKMLDPHPGVLHSYRRSAILRAPSPVCVTAARVTAIVLVSRLPAPLVNEVYRAKWTLGSILTGVGARREFIRVTHGGRTDESGSPIAFRVEAKFTLDGEGVALVREDVYEDVLGRRAGR